MNKETACDPMYIYSWILIHLQVLAKFKPRKTVQVSLLSISKLWTPSASSSDEAQILSC